MLAHKIVNIVFGAGTQAVRACRKSELSFSCFARCVKVSLAWPFSRVSTVVFPTVQSYEIGQAKVGRIRLVYVGDEHQGEVDVDGATHFILCAMQSCDSGSVGAHMVPHFDHLYA